jgi:hypothetical protein
MRTLHITVVCVLLVFTRCSGGGTGSDDTGDKPDLTIQEMAGDDAMLVETVQEVEKPSCSDNLVIEVFGLLDGIVLETGKEYTVQARIFDSVLKKEVTGETVTFSLVGSGDAKLLQNSAVTNEFGVAAVQLATGDTSGVDYTLNVANDCAGAASLAFETGDPEQGDLVVKLSLSQEVVDLGETLELEVYVDQYSTLCAAADFADPKGAMTPVPQGTMTVTIPDVLAGPSYIVVVIGADPQGLHIAAGCEEAVNILPEKTTETNVELFPIAVAPQGHYDIMVPVLFKQLLQGKWQDPAPILQQMTEQLAADISAAINEDLLPWYDDGIPEECPDALAQIEDDVAAALSQLPPEGVTQMAGESNAMLEQLLDSVTVTGQLELVLANEAGVYNATLDVLGAAFSGGPSCAPDCTTFTQDFFDLGEVHLQVEQSLFDITAEGADGIQIAPFQWTLSPGRFLLYAFVNVVMPEYGFEKGVDHLFQSLVDCEELVKAIDETTVACLKFHAAQIDMQKSCEDVMKGLHTQFYQQFAGLTAPQHLQTFGSGTLLDDDGDMKADGLQGSLTGDYLHDGITAGAFQFPLTGEKK